MDTTLLTVLGDLVSSPWFVAVAAIVIGAYLAALFWKILRSDEGFLLGYGNWVIGKWQTWRGTKPEEASPEDAALTPVGPHVAVMSNPAVTTGRQVVDSSQRDQRPSNQAKSAQDGVLTLSRLLDGDLAYMMMSGPDSWEGQILRGMQTIVSGATKVMSPARCRCGFFALDDEEQHLELIVGEGYGKSKRPLLALEHSCAGRAFLTGEDYYCHDMTTDPVYFHSEGGNRDFRSIACAPVRAGGAIFGVLCVDAREPNAFTAEDFDHLEVFATKLALFCGLHVLHAAGAGLLHNGHPSRS